MSDTDFAKVQLRDHLAGLFVPAISQGLWSIYDSAKELCKRNQQVDETMHTFQNMLTKIPEWSDHVLTTEVERIEKLSRCKYLDDLMMGVFIAYMKSFASLHYRGKAGDISVDFDRPSLNEFVHRMYIYSGRRSWQMAYLFDTFGVSTEKQARNRQDIERLVHECMDHVIRSFLPLEAIAKNLTQPAVVAEEESSADESSDDDSSVDESKKVKFVEDDSSEDEDERPPALKVSDDLATIDVQELDIPEEDPIKEIEKNVKESLVLKL